MIWLLRGLVVEYVEDDEYASQRDAAFSEVQALFSGRYSLEIVASVCSTMLCHSIAVASETVEAAEMLIDEYVESAIEMMRINWKALQNARKLLADFPEGRG